MAASALLSLGWLFPLRQHYILGFEIMPGMGDELAVARMIDGLDADDYLHQLRIVRTDVLDQFGLGIGRSGDKHRAGIRDGLRDSMKESVIFGGIAAADRVCLVVDVSRRIVRVQHQPFDVRWAEMEHARFMVINPNNRVKVMDCHKIWSFGRDGR
jgi:hypothetical protein